MLKAILDDLTTPFICCNRKVILKHRVLRGRLRRARQPINRSAREFWKRTLLLGAFILVLSFLPGNLKSLLHTTGRWHALGHFLVFCAATYVLSYSRAQYSFIACIVAIFACSVEVAQHLFYPGEIFEWKDVGIDLVGSTMGIAVAAQVNRRRYHRPSAK